MSTQGDMRQAIIPKSDQLNADDLIAGEMTIKITGVTVKGGQEQPVSIHFEGDNGKPYKACKSMCRVMVAAWGPDSSKYVGRSMTLYRDPRVKWAGMEVGGIRISHMSDIPGDQVMALTVTRGSKKPYTVKPLTVDAAPKSTDHAAALNAASSMDELGKAWSAIPKADQKKYAAVKDARKSALSQPATISDRIAACKTTEELDALADTLDETDVGIFFQTIAKRKTELSEAAL